MLFALTIFWNAFLLFLIQPMVARMLLPTLGGAPAVWNVCLVFFQFCLLAGYLYADRVIAWMGVKGMAALHLSLMIVSTFFLPFVVPGAWADIMLREPAIGLLLALMFGIGPFFLLVSAGSPSIQRWFAAFPAQTRGNIDPYRLSMAGNTGSLLALFMYPLFIEPAFSLSDQVRLWAFGYLVLILLLILCFRRLPRGSPDAKVSNSNSAVSLPAQRSLADDVPVSVSRNESLVWVGLAFLPSSLLSGVTTFVSTDVAAIPLLWIIPLALYLVSFIVAFSSWYESRHAGFLRWFPLLFTPVPFLLLFRLNVPMLFQLAWHPMLVFFISLAFHGELFRRRPPPERLTGYYVWMSIGGALGGAFNALLAPVLFSTAAEYPLGLAAAVLFAPSITREFQLSDPSTKPHPLSLKPLFKHLCQGAFFVFIFHLLGAINLFEEPLLKVSLIAVLAIAWVTALPFPRLYKVAIALFLVSSVWVSIHGREILYRERSFFGVHTVQRDRQTGVHLLQHGNIHHGWQSPASSARRLPLAYYSRVGPLGDLFSLLFQRDRSLTIGAVGLGTGALTAYGRSGDRFTLYEIDPAVSKIAWNPDFFTYLTDSAASLTTIIIDGRLGLAAASDSYDLLILDAYSSDAIPLHLMTREAMTLYLSRLKPDGIMAFHISNRYFDLEPIIGRIGADLGLHVRVRRHSPKELPLDLVPLRLYVNSSAWMTVSRTEADLGCLATHPEWLPPSVTPATPLWRDDFADLPGALAIRRPASQTTMP